eukprot:332878-Lingulodinium_polyedra.AAC.1
MRAMVHPGYCGWRPSNLLPKLRWRPRNRQPKTCRPTASTPARQNSSHRLAESQGGWKGLDEASV